MDAKTKRQIAREWLIFVGACAFGGTLLPAAIMLAVGKELRLGDFYAALVSNSSGDQGVALAVFFGPYIAIQLVRSVIWAYKIVKVKKEQA